MTVTNKMPDPGKKFLLSRLQGMMRLAGAHDEQKYNQLPLPNWISSSLKLVGIKGKLGGNDITI